MNAFVNTSLNVFFSLCKQCAQLNLSSISLLHHHDKNMSVSGSFKDAYSRAAILLPFTDLGQAYPYQCLDTCYVKACSKSLTKRVKQHQYEKPRTCTFQNELAAVAAPSVILSSDFPYVLLQYLQDLSLYCQGVAHLIHRLHVPKACWLLAGIGHTDQLELACVVACE